MHRGRIAGPPAGQSVGGFREAAGDETKARLHRFAAGLQRACGVLGRDRCLLKPGNQAVGVGLQLRQSPAGQDEREGTGNRCCSRHRWGGADHQVCVGAAGPEGADAGGQRRAGTAGTPGFGLRHQPETGCREVYGGVWAAMQQRRGQGGVAELQQHLRQPGHAGGGFQMADGGFYRADRAGCRAWVRREHGAEALDLEGVAQRRASAVRFDVVDVARRHARRGQRGADRTGLGRRAGDGVAVGAPAVIDRRSADHAVDAVAGRQRRRQRFQDGDRHALPGDVAVAAGAKAAAAAVGGGETALAQPDIFQRMQAEVDAACQRHLGLPGPQAAARQVQCRQRGGTGAVHRQAGAAQIQRVGQPVGDRPIGGTGRDGVAEGVLFGGQHLVVAVHDPDVDRAQPLRPPYEGRSGQAGILHRLPRGFQGEAFLRVHPFRLGGGDAEEQRVEAIDLRQEAAPARVGFAGAAGGWVEHAAVVPAGGRDFGDAVAAGDEIGPVCVEVVRPREAAGDADDGDGFGYAWGFVFCRRGGGWASGQFRGHFAQGAELVEQGLGHRPENLFQPVVQLHHMH